MSKSRLTYVGVTSIIIGLIVTVFFISGVLGDWQLRLSDVLFLSRTPRSNIVIIAIDDASINKIGRWPWNRSIYAALLNKIGQHASVIGIDVAFPEDSSSEDDLALTKALQKTRSVIPIEAIAITTKRNKYIVRVLQEPIKLFKKVTQQGLVNVLPDTDGIVRRVPFNVENEKGSRISSFTEQIVRMVNQRYLMATIPLEEGSLRINYTGKSGSFTRYSFNDVLTGTIPSSVFDRKIVLIGATALDLHDSHIVPVSNGVAMPGVEIHANSIETILSKRFLKQETTPRSLFTLWILTIIASFVFTFSSVKKGAVWLVSLGMSYAVYTILSFDSGVIRHIPFSVLTLSFTFVSSIFLKYLSEHNQRIFIRKAFQQYVSESLLKELIKNPALLTLGGVRKKMTVLFSDIEGFTSISERLDADSLTKILNEYLTEMTSVVFIQKGVIDKFIGDAVMAFWGAPVDDDVQELHACDAALLMQEKAELLRNKWSKLNLPAFNIRIGISTGEMVVGNMGSQNRFDYTVIGDAVNLGSRLESINKEYGTKILLSENTYKVVKEFVTARCIDVVAVKGKKQGVRVYELIHKGFPTAAERERFNCFEEIRIEYEKGNFQKATELCDTAYKKYPNDKVISLYWTRCTDYKANPPNNWDGVYHATRK